jgi:hypothetical protein
LRASKKKRLVIAALGTLAAVTLYFCAYFACLTVYLRYPAPVSGGLGSADARVYYKVGPLSQDFARLFFEPAQLIDAYYLRPKYWQDKHFGNKHD